MIQAIKEGRIRRFSELAWELLPDDKAGWELYAPEPEDLKKSKRGGGRKKKEDDTSEVDQTEQTIEE